MDPLQLHTFQMADRTISHILKWRETGKSPQCLAVAHLDSVTKAYWAQWDSLFFKEGGGCIIGGNLLNLVRRHGSLNSIQHFASVLKLLHDTSVGGHLGLSRTLGKGRQRFYWIHCRRDVEEWCYRCDLCDSKKGPRAKQKSPLQLYTTGEPMECVAIDVRWPLPETEHGNKYILIVIDYFSKRPEDYALPN